MKERIGILTVSISDATIIIKSGDFEETVQKITSGIPSNHHKGGQSQGRYTRKRDEAIKEFARRVESYTKNVIVDRWEVRGNNDILKSFRTDI